MVVLFAGHACSEHLRWCELAADGRVHLAQLPILPGLFNGVAQFCQVDAAFIAVILEVIIPASALQLCTCRAQ